MFPPGAEFLDAADLIVSAAKTFDQNALGPYDMLNTWLNQQHGISGIGIDPISLFSILLGASDQIGVSQGCSRRSVTSCVTPKPHPKPAQDIPRASGKDPWDGEGAP